MHEPGWRYALGVFDEAVERATRRHQTGNLGGVDIGDGAGQNAVLDLRPLRDALCLKPSVERVEIGKAGHGLPQPPPRILDVPLDLPFLPTRGRVAELGLKQIMARHRPEPRVDLPGLARTDPIDRGPHVIEDPPPRHAAQHPERLGQRVEQHLVGLERISPNREGATVRELGMRHLQLGLPAAQHRPVLAPVELESLARGEHQWHERTAPAGLRLALPLGLPRPDEGVSGASAPR